MIRSKFQPEESEESPPGISFATRPFSPNHFPSLQKFTSGSSAEFKKVLAKIGTTHFLGQNFAWVQTAWVEFALTIPNTDDVSEYNDDHPVVLPLYQQLWAEGGSFNPQHHNVPTPAQATSHNAFTDGYADRMSVLDITLANVTTWLITFSSHIGG